MKAVSLIRHAAEFGLLDQIAIEARTYQTLTFFSTYFNTIHEPR